MLEQSVTRLTVKKIAKEANVEESTWIGRLSPFKFVKDIIIRSLGLKTSQSIVNGININTNAQKQPNK